mmetsp:Transcript_169095/g.543495  ORF Transcript_169095/g.543495 Transcript_169095/m.543495 type:complete len:215 (+) Transcript_169095:792-1436(+)
MPSMSWPFTVMITSPTFTRPVSSAGPGTCSLPQVSIELKPTTLRGRSLLTARPTSLSCTAISYWEQGRRYSKDAAKLEFWTSFSESETADIATEPSFRSLSVKFSPTFLMPNAYSAKATSPSVTPGEAAESPTKGTKVKTMASSGRSPVTWTRQRSKKPPPMAKYLLVLYDLRAKAKPKHPSSGAPSSSSFAVLFLPPARGGARFSMKNVWAAV